MLLAVATVALGAGGGCGCGEEKASAALADSPPEAVGEKAPPLSEGAIDDDAADLEDDSTEGEEAVPTAAELALERKLQELETLHGEGRHAYVAGEAAPLLRRADLPAELRMRVAFMLATAYGEIGEDDRADEAWQVYQTLRAEVLASKAMKAQARAREAAQSLARKVREARLQFLPEEDRERTNEMLARRLERTRDDEVLAVELPFGGKAHCSRKPEGLSERLEQLRASHPGAVVQHDLEFDFYYVLVEAPPPPSLR